MWLLSITCWLTELGCQIFFRTWKRGHFFSSSSKQEIRSCSASISGAICALVLWYLLFCLFLKKAVWVWISRLKDCSTSFYLVMRFELNAVWTCPSGSRRKKSTKKNQIHSLAKHHYLKGEKSDMLKFWHLEDHFQLHAKPRENQSSTTRCANWETLQIRLFSISI